MRKSTCPLLITCLLVALGPGAARGVLAEDAPKPAAIPSPQDASAPAKPALPGLQIQGATKPALPPGGAPTEAVKRTSDPQAVAIVEAYLKAVGGKDTLAKIKDRVTKFSNIKHAATGETEAEINLLIKEGLMIREEWEIKGFDIKGEKLAFVQIYNGQAEEGWVQMLGTVSPLDGRTLQVFVWDKQMDDFFCHWAEDGFTLELAGQGIVPKEILGEETPCDIVLATDFSGRQQQRFFFSKKDSLLIKKEWQDAGTNPKATVKKEQYSKLYRDLAFKDGSGLKVKFPLKLEIYLDGDLDTERVYTNVQFNSNLSDKLFDKPEGKPFTGAPQAPTDPKDKKKVQDDLPPWKRDKAKSSAGPKVITPPAESTTPVPSGEKPAEKPAQPAPATK